MSPADERRESDVLRTSRDAIAYRDVDSQMGEFARTVEFNERILQRLQQFELMLLDSATLPAILDVLLHTTPTHFDLNGVSLSLYDPNGSIAELLSDEPEFDFDLTLEQDNFDMQQLYGARPEVEYVACNDPRALRAIADVDSGQSVVMLPLVRDGIVVGSFHWVSETANAFGSEIEREFLNHLAAIIAICLENCSNAGRLSRLSLLDPLTRLSNRRAFELELRKELSRAHRSQKPLTLLLIEIDDYRKILESYGHLAADFAVKSVASHVAGMLRSTDHIARIGNCRFALLLPACEEGKGQEIAERMRSETEFLEIDDGRRANLFASLSIGITGWVPKHYPAINMEQLAGQFKSVAVNALEKSAASGGNRVSLSRLSPMLV
jgi:diguanylate cyclase (GGDEF)-like protein